jgi:hypothetical protein
MSQLLPVVASCLTRLMIYAYLSGWRVGRAAATDNNAWFISNLDPGSQPPAEAKLARTRPGK